MRIDYPQIISLMLVLIPILLIMIRSFINGRRDLRRITGLGKDSVLLNTYLVKWFFSELFFLLFVIFAVLSLMGLSWGKKPIEEDREGLELVCVLDISRSMLANDIEPSRLKRSAALTDGLVNELEGGKFSVVLFKGKAVKVVPMTEDTAVIHSLTDTLTSGFITSPGTNIEEGLEEAIAAFPEATRSHKVILLFSDGEDLSGNPSRILRHAVSDGIPIFTVGLGSEEGSPIRLSDNSLVRNDKGEVVISKLDTALLKEIAEESGGRYFDARQTNLGNSLRTAVYDIIGQRNNQGFRLVQVKRFRLFLSLSMLFLLIHTGIRIFKWKGVF